MQDQPLSLALAILALGLLGVAGFLARAANDWLARG